MDLRIASPWTLIRALPERAEHQYHLLAFGIALSCPGAGQTSVHLTTIWSRSKSLWYQCTDSTCTNIVSRKIQGEDWRNLGPVSRVRFSIADVLRYRTKTKIAHLDNYSPTIEIQFQARAESLPKYPRSQGFGLFSTSILCRTWFAMTAWDLLASSIVMKALASATLRPKSAPYQVHDSWPKIQVWVWPCLCLLVSEMAPRSFPSSTRPSGKWRFERSAWRFSTVNNLGTLKIPRQVPFAMCPY